MKHEQLFISPAALLEWFRDNAGLCRTDRLAARIGIPLYALKGAISDLVDMQLIESVTDGTHRSVGIKREARPRASKPEFVWRPLQGYDARLRSAMQLAEQSR